MDNDNIPLLCPGNQLFIKMIRRNAADRVQGIGNHHKLRSLKEGFVDSVKIRQVIVFRPQLIGVNLCHGKGRSYGKDRVARIRHQHHISRVTENQPDMGDALLRAVNVRDLPLA